jgi:hypothetical protein
MLCFACAVIVWHIPCKDTRLGEGSGQTEGASRQAPRPGGGWIELQVPYHFCEEEKP